MPALVFVPAALTYLDVWFSSTAQSGWTPASMPTGRHGCKAARTGTNTIIVVGGATSASAAATVAETYDLSTNGWSTAASMSTGRSWHGLAPLPDGRIMAAGGGDAMNNPMSSVEIYNPSTNTWSAGTAMSMAKYGFELIPLGNGTISAAGGRTAPGASYIVDDHIIYNPSSNTWSARAAVPWPMKAWHGGAPLASGEAILIAGDEANGGSGGNVVDVYNASSNTWTRKASLPEVKARLAAALLADGRVAALAGYTSTITASCHAYQPSSDTWSAIASAPTARQFPAAATVGDGKVVLVGGGNNFLRVNEIYL